ncbi:unnamed protein product [Cuscuta campestris]|uniref:Retroviral polymerase SH3-like domain-containing protein n=1 Tax=Cuscuta campestris TaxID=132261 RepID=A0A484LYV4_9ASTE|nr:unnamed protein product [Cuscuta campestris]
MTSSKLEPKSVKVIFVGYPKETRGYEFYHPSDNKIFVARNGTFLEKEFLSAITSGRKVNLEEIREPQEEVPIVLEPEQRVQAIEPQIAQDIPRSLVYGGEEELKVVGYTDASFQTDRDDSKSQAGYLFCLNGGAFSWKSFKEDTTADSTTEAEYIAAAEAAKEAVWIKKFITELGVVPSINDPILLFCNNTRAIAQAKEPRSHQKTKHIVRCYHIIREIVDRGDVMICKVDTDDNIADPLTKPLGKLKHEGHTRSMGIRPMPDWP